MAHTLPTESFEFSSDFPVNCTFTEDEKFFGDSFIMSGIEWKIFICPTEKSTDLKCGLWCSVFLDDACTAKWSLECVFKWELVKMTSVASSLSLGGNELTATDIFSDRANSFTGLVLPREKLEKSQFLENGHFRIKVSITMPKVKFGDPMECYAIPLKGINRQINIQDRNNTFRTMLENPRTADLEITIQFGEKDEMKKVVLKVFKSPLMTIPIFKSKIDESRGRGIMIERQVSPHPIISVLRLIYDEGMIVIHEDFIKETLECFLNYFGAGDFEVLVPRLNKTIRTDNVFTFFKFCYQARSQFDVTLMLEACTQFLTPENFMIALSSGFQKFCELDESHLKELLTLPVAGALSQVKLYTSCVEWAKNQPRSLNESGMGLRLIMGPIIKCIKFKEMSIDEFIGGPGEENILTGEEKYNFLVQICDDLKM